MDSFFFILLQTVATQVLGLFGIFFLFGFALARLQHTTQRLYMETVGWRGILWTAWIGTPIHELGHIFFAKLFRHKIEHVSLFAPNRETGGLGHVEHSYQKSSLYQRIGNFFIGAAPLLFGGFFLVLLLSFLVPEGKDIFLSLSIDKGSLPTAEVFLTFFLTLFSPEHVQSWQFWLFLYISFAITSHMAPSKQDQRGMWHGFAWIVILLIILNGIALLVGADLSALILSTSQYGGIIIAMFLYALLISLVHFLLATLILFPLKKRG